MNIIRIFGDKNNPIMLRVSLDVSEFPKNYFLNKNKELLINIDDRKFGNFIFKLKIYEHKGMELEGGISSKRQNILWSLIFVSSTNERINLLFKDSFDTFEANDTARSFMLYFRPIKS